MAERVVLAYGDSNTHGTAPMATLEDMLRFGPAERWPGVMAAELGAGWRVVEEGLPGRTTVHPDPISGVHKNGLALLPAALESHRPVDVVALMLGTNDLKNRFQVPVVEIADSVSQLVHYIRHSYTGPGEAQPAVLLIARVACSLLQPCSQTKAWTPSLFMLLSSQARLRAVSLTPSRSGALP